MTSRFHAGLSALIATLLTTAAFSPSSSRADAEWRLRYAHLDITLRPSDRSISGAVRLVLDPPRDATPLRLDFADSMVVDSVSAGARGESTRFEREHGRLRIDQSPTSSWCGKGSAGCVIRVWFHGVPNRSAFGMIDRAGKLRGGSYGMPNSAREWWPTLDSPAQKMDSSDVSITVPAGIIAASNGVLRDRRRNPDASETFHWAERYPIYSDVISVAAADYVERHASFVSSAGCELAGGCQPDASAANVGSRIVPLMFFVFPEDTLKADADFASVPSILAFLEARLGPYPFSKEKYGIAEFTRPSFREHQTLPSLGAGLITGDGSVGQIIAHEASHQWFGNSLTVSDWRDIWLNESFAEYMAWTWVRSTRGDTAFDALWRGAADRKYPASLAHADSGGFASMFGALTFQKGPVVLLMLEDLIGAKAMAAALRSYVAKSAYGHASLAEFQRSAESATHKELGWFFEQWTTRADAPEVSLAWTYEKTKGRIRATITQSESGAPFRLPLQLRVTSAAGKASLILVDVRRAREEFVLPVVDEPSSVAIATDRTLIRVAAQPPPKPAP